MPIDNTSVQQSDAVISKVGREYLALQMAPGVGPIRVRRLLERFGSVDKILGASRSQLLTVEGIGDQAARALDGAGENELIDREIELAAEAGVRILCLADAAYPVALRQAPDPPTCLYVRGRLDPADAVAVAIVGTRCCSHYASEQASRFGELLGRAGFVVVSGLARGVDGLAHSGALRGGGRTIAVLGNGLSRVYPAEHARLAHQIEEHGALLSELPMDAAPEAKNFPGRNRIIAGLSLGVLVVEAPKRSGALITARLASEYNKEVFAIPGRIDVPSQTAGTNGLIRDSAAKLVTCLEDILDELGDVGTIMGQVESTADNQSVHSSTNSPIDSQRIRGSLSPIESQIMKAIDAGHESADDIAESTGQPVGNILSSLTALQLKGQLSQRPGPTYVRRRSKRV